MANPITQDTVERFLHMEKVRNQGDSLDIDISKYNLKRVYIENKNLYKIFNYLTEPNTSSFYELLTGHLCCEFTSIRYSHEVIDFILKDKDFSLVTLSKQGDEYDNSKKTCSYYILLWSKKKDIALKLISRDRGVYLTLTSKDVGVLCDYSKSLEKYLYKESKCEIGLFYQDGGRTDIRKIPIDPVEVDVKLNYGKDFLKKHKSIVSKMMEKKGGLYIFHGPPAGGKTSYIKYLSQSVDRLFIFIPSGLVDSIDSPSLVSILLNYERPVLILEDAEKAVQSRKSNANSSIVSTLLNLSDGILSSMLGVSVIVTFNTGKENIDDALIRKGRLMVEHEFGPLSVSDSNKLAKSLGKKNVFDKPQMIGNIFNVEEETFHREVKKEKFGFGN